MDEIAIARFWSKVDKRGPDECWEWKARRDPDGYGVFWYDGKNRRASRMAWLSERGPEGMAGMLMCHRCDNPPCCNPAHLFLGTNTDNLRDMAAKKRSTRFLGEAHPGARITTETVLAIRQLAATGEPHLSIAGRFGISQTQTSRIIKRTRWGHI
jgi:hypothetical protein